MSYLLFRFSDDSFIEIPKPDADVETFLRRLAGAVADDAISDAELLAMATAPDNPAQLSSKPDTKADNSLMHSLIVHLINARHQRMKVQVDECYDVNEAAAYLGLSGTRVRNVLTASGSPLKGFKPDGRNWRIAPASVHEYREHVKGPGRPRKPALVFAAGSAPGYSLHIKAKGSVITDTRDGIRIGHVQDFERAAIRFTTNDRNSMFVLVRTTQQKNRYEVGPFYVEGLFRIERRINHPRKAREAFTAFSPE